MLADIDAAVRPVERARTAAAVDRVLATASPAHGPWPAGAAWYWSKRICAEVGVEQAHTTYCDTDCPRGGSCEVNAVIPRDDATPGLAAYFGASYMASQHLRYAPWNVSPHLFPTDPR